MTNVRKITTRVINAIEVNPVTKTAKPIKIALPDKGNVLEPFYKIIDCRLCEIVTLDSTLRVVIDEEGLLKHNHHYAFPGWGKSPLAGIGIIVGEDTNGDFVSVPDNLSSERVERYIDFLGDDHGLEKAIKSGRVDRPSSSFATSLDPDAVRTTIWEWSPHDAPRVDETVH